MHQSERNGQQGHCNPMKCCWFRPSLPITIEVDKRVKRRPSLKRSCCPHCHSSFISLPELPQLSGIDVSKDHIVRFCCTIDHTASSVDLSTSSKSLIPTEHRPPINTECPNSGVNKQQSSSYTIAVWRWTQATRSAVIQSLFFYFIFALFHNRHSTISSSWETCHWREHLARCFGEAMNCKGPSVIKGMPRLSQPTRWAAMGSKRFLQIQSRFVVLKLT